MTEAPPAEPATIAPWPGWVFKGSGDLPRCLPRWWRGNPECREPASSDRLPVHRSESPTGYSSAGCSPAEPASASPVLTILAQSRSGEAIKCSAQPHCAVQALAPRLVMAPELGRVRRHQECHLYFARRVSFLSCADNPGGVACDEFVERPERVRVWRELTGNEMGAPVTTLPGKAGAVRSSGPCRNCSWAAPPQTDSRAVA